MKALEINQKIAERMWKFISWEKGINPSLDGLPVTYENAPLVYRAFCRALAWTVMEELGIIEPGGGDTNLGKPSLMDYYDYPTGKSCE